MASELKGFAALKSRQIWTWQFALFAVINYAIAFTIVDVVPLPLEGMPWAILSEFICIAILLTLGIAVRKIVLSLPEEKTQGIWLNASLFIAVVFLTNFIGSPILHLQGEFGITYWTQDVVIGLLGGVYIGLMYLALFGVQQLQIEAAQRLEITRVILKETLANSAKQIAAHQEALIDRTKSVLVPVIEEIKNLLASTKDSDAILERFKLAVYKDVATLVEGAKRLEKRSSELVAGSSEQVKVRPQFHVHFRTDLKPLSIWLSYLPGLVLLVKVDSPIAVAGFTLGNSIVLFALLAAVKFLFFPERLLRTVDAVGILVSISLIHSGLAALLGPIWLSAGDVAVVTWITSYGSLVLSLCYTLVNARNRSRAAALEELASATRSLETANDRLNRSLWVASMRWHSLLHGQVQSTLTRCILSLGPHRKISKVDRETLLALLENITEVLDSKPHFDFDFESSVQQTIETWAGVCKVIVKRDSIAKASIKKDDTLGYVLNEIIKEQVSNLYSQIKPERIAISLKQNVEGELTIESISTCAAPIGAELPKENFNKLNFIAPSWNYSVNGKQLEVDATLSVA